MNPTNAPQGIRGVDEGFCIEEFGRYFEVNKLPSADVAATLISPGELG